MNTAKALPRRRLAPLSVAALCAMVVAGCFLRLHPDPASSAPSGDEIVITQEQIAQLGVATAWEAIKRKVPQLTFRENSAGQPTRIWRHGRGSVYLNETPLLFVDGVRISDIRTLGEIPASEVEVIRVRTGLSSSAEYGTGSVGGVILVQTRSGR